MRLVLIGTGVAGMSAIEAIRSIDGEDEIVMVGDDPHGYYSRPGLAYYLTGELHEKALYPRTAADYESLNFHFVNARVKSIQKEFAYTGA